ncbi:Signal transduction histidine kinase [Sphingobacterium nematocida]|uniref:histidine kinase n=1 Tax=Sphingobacterium nematocida TaxID=1513896 RepID=A0A1T5GBF7_9SPHI|nr:HAMP domain-containing sensor histidine kinase [Sphingobacterium nematocida]SKC05651.1 Signal transduction histidine kinase [Sphingobacterium nematocida]
MKLKHRLSLYSVVIFSIITLVISSVIYISFYAVMEGKERESLESKSLLAAIYYLEQDELSLIEHESIKSQLLKTISRRNIILLDKENKHFKGDMPWEEVLDSVFINRVRMERIAHFETGEFFYNGIFYEDNQGNFVVITREPKNEFNAQMKSLFHVLLVVSLLGMGFIYVVSQYLGKIAYEPIVHVIGEIKRRDAKNFNEPIVLTASYYEINDLILTYNHFVDRIAKTFTVQKNFIDYVSHELRTPITALLGTLEVTNSKKRTIEEYEAVILQLKQYTTDLQDTLENMTLLSGAKTSFEFSTLRVDEIVWSVIENAVLYHQAKIDVDMQVENNQLLSFQGNDKLLELAIGNIVENALKYSNNDTVKIVIKENDGRLSVCVQDKGIGILNDDLKDIKKNFFRGQNVKGYQGKGIGLSMANVIFQLHHIALQIESDASGTTVILLF